jgi:hypothetical protein
MTEDDKIVIDLDRDRIKTILLEAYKISGDYLETEFDLTAEQFVNKIDPYLDCNRVTIPVQLSLNSRKYPGLLIEVDLRQRKVMARMFPKSKQATLNHFLKPL